jgi:hypothetical protein
MSRHRKVRTVLTTVRRHPVLASAIGLSLLGASVFTSQSMASATPEPTLAVSASALNAAPAPDVQVFAQGPAVQVTHGPHSVNLPHVDGCDHNYGYASQCVPWAIPAGSPAADCAWLKSNGFGPLKVTGSNRQDLPETMVDGEPYVCA